jgi:putative addiction module component (TIGR02574 family)
MGADVPDPGGSADPDIEEAWDAETLRRVEELESGAVEGIPWSEVRERLFRDFD